MSKKYIFLSYFLIFNLIVGIFSPLFLYKNIAKAVTVTPSLSGGFAHSVMLKADGTVWTWGRNEHGELGLSNTTNSYEPKRIDPSKFGNSPVVRVESGVYSNIALTQANKVYIWGSGSGSTPSQKTIPFSVSDIDISAPDSDWSRQTYSVVNQTDGTVWSWSWNGDFDFGNGLNGYSGANNCVGNYVTNNLTQALISATIDNCTNGSGLKTIRPGTEVPLTGVVDISMNGNYFYTIALTQSGDVYTWGKDYSGFAVQNTKISSNDYDIQKVEAGPVPFFLTKDGKAYTFTGSKGVPIQITLEGSNEKIVDIVSSKNTVYFLGETGKVYAIGSNRYYQMGSSIVDGTYPISKGIAAYIDVNNVTAIGTGEEHVLFYKSDKSVTARGRNNYGQLANSNDNTISNFKKLAVSDIKEIDAVLKTSYIVDNHENLYSFGSNGDNMLLSHTGRTTLNPNSPQIVKNFAYLGGIRSMNGKGSNEYTQGTLVAGNGDVYTWGDPWRNGTGGGGDRNAIKKINNTNMNIDGSLFDFEKAVMMRYGGVGVTANGKVYSWGQDRNGVLGMGVLNTYWDNALQMEEPAGLLGFQVPLLPSEETFMDIDVGEEYALALMQSGDVYSWGRNDRNQLGYSTSSQPNSPTPYKISTISNIKKIANGNCHNLALDVNGDVWSWGCGGAGQLGLGNSNSTMTPTKITGLPKIKNIGTGNTFSFAIAENGDLYSWGQNTYGQLGLGDNVNRNAPRKTSLQNVKKVDGGKDHTLVLMNDGTVWSAGADSFGQLGLGQTEGISEETPIIFVPVLTLTTPDNQIFEQGQTLRLTGNVYTESPNIPITISYKIDSSSGTHVGTIEDYVSTQGSHPFTYDIPLDSTYPENGYTAFVTVQTNNGIRTTQSINFGIMDKIHPTLIVDNTNQSVWKTTPVTVNIAADDTGGSGYRGVNYAWSTSMTKPLIDWSGVIPNTQIQTSQNKSGKWYLHAESFDNAGNTTYKVFGPYQIDKDGPNIHITYPPGWQQDTLNVQVDIQDEFNAVVTKKWIEGIVDEQIIKRDGKVVDFTSKTIDKNNSFTFYAEDSLGNTSLQYITIKNINHPPNVENALLDSFVPYDKKELHFNLQTKEPDIGDTLTFVYQINNGKENEIPLGKTIIENPIFDVTLPLENVPSNQQIAIQYYVKDEKEGKSNVQTFQMERYQANLSLIRQDISSNQINWDTSSSSEAYILKRNGTTIYEGTQNTFVDVNIQNNKTYTYELFIKKGNVIEKIEEVEYLTGEFSVQVPNSVQFNSFQLQQNQSIYETKGTFSDNLIFTNTTDLKSDWNIHMNVKPFFNKHTNSALPNVRFNMYIPNLVDENGTVIENGKEYVSDFENDISLFRLSSANAKGIFTLPLTTQQANLQVPFSSIMNQADQTYQSTIEWKFVSAP